MSENQIDHEAIRARVEKRLAPRMRLLRKRSWLFAHVIVYLGAMALIYSSNLTNHAPFFFVTSYATPESSFLDSSGTMITIPSQTYENWQAYPLVTFLSWVWLVLVFWHI